jgi:endonuclease-8
MPDGDTIWRTARALHAALAGKAVLAFDSSLVAVAAAARRLGVVGQTIEAVEARGKHLLVRFAGGAVLHTHQGMRGSWRLARRPGAARRPRRGACGLRSSRSRRREARRPLRSRPRRRDTFSNAPTTT